MKKPYKQSFFYKNSLTIVFIFLFFLSLLGQAVTGWKEHNEFLKIYGQPAISLAHYFYSGHFIQATFENWESEFLQMALFVILSIFFRQQGSSESKSLEENEVDKEPLPHTGAPWPVKKGGFILTIYKNSLSIAFLLMFIFSFTAHFYGSWLNFNEQQTLQHKPTQYWNEYVINSKLWFESFQNWQSEFLSVAAIVVLSVFLRQKGSAQSKPVDMPDYETDA